MARSWLSTTSTSWVQAIFLPQPPELLGTHHHAWLSFVFLGETRFLHVGQAGHVGLKDLPASDFQSARITGMSHHAQPSYFALLKFNFLKQSKNTKYEHDNLEN